MGERRERGKVKDGLSENTRAEIGEKGEIVG
jgi:hypothetical protein